MNGAEWLARSLHASDTRHLFFVDAVLRRTLLECERIGVQPVLAHTEKAAVYMADAYARVSGRPGVSRRPAGRTQPASISTSIVPFATCTPRTASGMTRSVRSYRRSKFRRRAVRFELTMAIKCCHLS